MPYIAPKNRKELDGLIDELAKKIEDEAQRESYHGAFLFRSQE
jgi:hypothetical protein